MFRKKQFIQVKGNAQYARPIKPNAILTCPTTGASVLCHFPECAHLASGPVSLQEGKHWGPNKGHGFQHVWQEHFAAIADRGEAEVQVFAFLRAILISGASIHYEPPNQDRATISVRSPVGLVIVQANSDARNATVYRIVTAFPGQPKGVLIGSL
jgi:hypothetical protein